MSKKDRRSDSRDRIELPGTIVDTHPGGMFTVRTDTGIKILATVCGKIRKNFIRVIAGDNVIVELSPYDTSRGRITKRLGYDNNINA